MNIRNMLACWLGLSFAVASASAADQFVPDWTAVSTVAFTGRTAAASVVMPAGKRAQLGFELSGEAVNPVVDGRLFRVTLDGPDEKLVCHDGHR